MEAFEDLVAMLLQREGYWVRTSYKVNLTKSEKASVGRPTTPRWEIDIVAYKAAANTLRLVECKSYLDSAGVRRSSFDPADKRSARYKLFNDARLRRTVTRRLTAQLVEEGSCRRSPNVTLCLAAGRIKSDQDRASLHRLFRRHKWLLLDEEWILSRLRAVALSGYENDVAAVVAKLLERASRAA